MAHFAPVTWPTLLHKTHQNVKRIREALSKLQSPFRKKDFAVSIIFDGEEVTIFEEYNLQDVLNDAILKFVGQVDKNGFCTYSLNGIKGTLDLVANLKQEGVPSNREYFYDQGNLRKPECGPFGLKFYVFDIEKISDVNMKRYLRDHRTYIYRDDIRVYPYGDGDNDWIKLDIYRGLIKASYYLSNDQVMGYISISSKNNPALRDKTNREGLVEQGTAYEDLRMLTLSALDFLNTEFRKTNKIIPHQNTRKRGQMIYFFKPKKWGKESRAYENTWTLLRMKKGRSCLGASRVIIKRKKVYTAAKLKWWKTLPE